MLPLYVPIIPPKVLATASPVAISMLIVCTIVILVVILWGMFEIIKDLWFDD